MIYVVVGAVGFIIGALAGVFIALLPINTKSIEIEEVQQDDDR